MKTGNIVTVRRCFSGLLTTGMFLLFVGIVVEPTMPHFILDRVLLTDELADEAKRDATLALLQKANGNRGLIWIGAGMIVIVLSSIGLRATQCLSRTVIET